MRNIEQIKGNNYDKNEKPFLRNTDVDYSYLIIITTFRHLWVFSCLDIRSFIGMRKVTLSVSRQTCFYLKGTCPGIISSKKRWFYFSLLIWPYDVLELQKFFSNFCAAHLLVRLDVETKFSYILFLTWLLIITNREFRLRSTKIKKTFAVIVYGHVYITWSY